MPHHCCVPLCTSDSRQDKFISFHSFPKNKDLCKQWLINIRRDPGSNFSFNSHTRICSHHFCSDSYSKCNFKQIHRRLKPGSVPTIFNWTSIQPPRRIIIKHTVATNISVCKEDSEECLDNQGNITDTHEDSLINVSSASSPNKQCVHDNNIVDSQESSVDSLINVSSDSSPNKQCVQSVNLQLHTLRNDERFRLSRFVNSDSDIKHYTGFQSYISLHSFYQYLQPECNFLYYAGTTNTSSGTPYDLINKRGPSRALSPLEELFITLIRLRKGLSEKLIADLYLLSEGQVSKIINTWILFLADRLKFLPIWPTKEHVRDTLPLPFRLHYPTTRAIVDCTEFFIEQPSASLCQRETFSTYKHHNTAKGLLAISPEGQITFLSQLYAGRCSDKKIIRHCGLLDLLEEGDSLMVDRGFDIAEDLEKRGVTLCMPSFLQGQAQFTESQLDKSRSIAAVRVHVERAVRKIKEFEILRNITQIALCPMLEKIWFVCGHLANFSGHLCKPTNK